MGKRTPADQAERAMREAGLEPLVPFPGKQQAPWLCRCTTCGKEVDPYLGSILAGRNGCRYCSGRAIDQADAVEVMRSAGFEPIDDWPGGGAKPWLCRCVDCGRESTPRYNNVKSSGTTCKYCSGNAADPAEASDTMRAAGLEPLVPYPGRHVPWLCRCNTCGREVSPRLGGVLHGQGGCRWCAPNAPVDEDQAAEIMRAAGVEPLVVYPGSDAPWLSLCMRCGREVSPRYGHIRTGTRGGCVYCSGKVVDEADAVELMRAAGLEPLDPYPGAQVRWRCRCGGCGAEVFPRWNGIQQGQGGCKACASHGFDPSQPGSLYLMRHDELRAWQVGITNQPKKRIAAHRRQGWELVEVREFDSGYDAASIERSVLVGWRMAGFRSAATLEQMPQGGYTETVSWDDVPGCSLDELISLHAQP